MHRRLTYMFRNLFGQQILKPTFLSGCCSIQGPRTLHPLIFIYVQQLMIYVLNFVMYCLEFLGLICLSFWIEHVGFHPFTIGKTSWQSETVEQAVGNHLNHLILRLLNRSNKSFQPIYKHQIDFNTNFRLWIFSLFVWYILFVDLQGNISIVISRIK